MSYLPLARKYRPQTFDELVGQPHVTTTLIRAIETKRVGQAYLFTGQRGVGKTSAARILAKCLNCAQGPAAKPCLVCQSCLAILAGSSLDVIEIDGASNRGIDDIRQLREQVKFAPVQGNFRIYIIDEVHQITQDAFNALLKTLEEPPAHVKFIFATTAPHKVPPTILSRCQRFDFRRLDSQTIVSALKPIAEAERIAIEEAALYAVARAAEGSLRDAEVILEQLVSFCPGRIEERDVSQLLGSLEQDALLVWTEALLDCDASAALALLNQHMDRGRDVTQLLVGLVMHFRNLLILRATVNAPSRQELLAQLVDAPTEQLARLDEQAKRSPLEELLLMAQLLTGAYELARRSPFAQAVLEFALIKLARRESWASVEESIQRLERLAQSDIARMGSKDLPESPIHLDLPAPTALQTGEANRQATSKPVANSASFAVGSETHTTSCQPEPMTPGSCAGSSSEENTISLDEAVKQWPKVLECIGQRKMSLAAYLADAKPIGVSGKTVRIGLPAFALHQEVLSLPDNLCLIEQTLSEVIGWPIILQCTTLPEPTAEAYAPSVAHPGLSATVPEASEEPTPPVVQDIVKLFDATIIDRPESKR